MEVFTHVARLQAGDSRWSPELLSSTSQSHKMTSSLKGQRSEMSVSLEHRKHTPVLSNEGEAAGPVEGEEEEAGGLPPTRRALDTGHRARRGEEFGSITSSLHSEQ